MSSKDIEAKDKILRAAIGLLESTGDPASVTVRQIAEAANVGIGLINYHFQSKDKLLNEAAGVILSRAADVYIAAPPSGTPAERLSTMLRDLSDLMIRYESLNRLTISYILANGDYGVPLLITPMLRDIWPHRSEFELRLVACQLIVPMQFAFLRPDEFRLFSGCDIHVKDQRDSYIARAIANFL